MMEPTVVTYRLVSPKGTELLEILKELIFVGFVRDQENCPYMAGVSLVAHKSK